MIAIIDYGAGNLRSVCNAISVLGHRPAVTSDADDVLNAEVVVLPGVGAAADTMTSLQRLGLDTPIRQRIGAGRSLLGVCMGLQVLLTSSEEGNGCACLDVVPGRVRKLPAGLKVPHMGWNQVRQRAAHPLFAGIPDGANFYFVHSYYAEPAERDIVAGETDYGISFCSVIIKDNLVATQFHPEKSGDMGLRFYDNFIRMASGGEGRGA